MDNQIMEKKKKKVNSRVAVTYKNPVDYLLLTGSTSVFSFYG